MSRFVSADSIRFGHAAKECISNAHSLVSSAEVLGQAGAYGQACALLTIALEELGKAVAFKLCAEGFGSIEGERRGRRVVLKLPVLGREELSLFNHAGKRGVPVSLEFVVKVLPGLPKLFIALSETRPSAPKGSAPAAAVASPEIPMRPTASGEPDGEKEFDEMRERIRRESDLLHNLGDLKEAGFYVDFDGKDLKVPRAISQDTYELAARVVGGYVQVVEEAVDRGIVSGVIVDVLAAGMELLDHFTKK
jgi:AbiV